MANIRKRSLPSGLIRWEVAYMDGGGQRRAKLFGTKGAAQAWLVEAQHDIKRGLHTAASVSPTVKEAAALWIKRCQEKELERSTVRSYEEHVDLHLVPLIGLKKLADLTMPGVSEFADRLREVGRSPEMVRRVVRSLGAIFREARRRGLAATDPTAGLDLNLSTREDPRVVIPAKAELQAIIATAAGRWRPLILTAIFCGLRGSELRGLRWSDVGFNSAQIHVNQRADAFHKIGRLKSRAAYRSIPCNPMVLNALREWKLVCPKGDQDLVFPTGAGKVESHSNIVQRGFEPVQIAAGVVEIRDGVPVAKYGLHTLRHACASLWIEQGHNPKQIQNLMGHSTIQMVFDTYGHLFADLAADQKAAEEIMVRLLEK
ncbi:site-specific integrase [Bradyrhizobium sp. JYMT SZCCT0428]|uniref:tyrosine-type recombinase/integrase n=1 Tax=Bradyrhizobium sp. JYMT SZCCT0428 TaxID=2807673 RepID=UPI001BA992C0|nr:site-specific integrase [Bradyrhizobium sp. JYMT SZCCT0428]MBR1153151.1 site-specific integrase [Bradyrhizobium sp. JYMT SZCCT0428]